MLILAFDCCLGGCSAALADSGDVIAVQRGDDAPAEILVPMVRELLARQGVGWAELSVLAVTIGPGSFTGIRTGLAAARGFALAGRLEIFPIGALEAIAFSILEPDDPRSILIINDARRNEVFVQRFNNKGAELAPAVRCAASDISAEVVSTHRLGGSGTALLSANNAEPERQIDARFVAAAAQARGDGGQAPVSGMSVAPIYLRRPVARATAGRPLVSVRK